VSDAVSLVELRADYLIIGSGIAALRAALALADAGDVLILTKSEPGEGNTGYAQGGIAAALGDDDSPALHAADTIAAGDGLCDAAAVEALVSDGPRYVQELITWGGRFDRQAGGQLSLAREAAHSVRRVLHAQDRTGREIGRVLGERVRALAGVRVLDHAVAFDLSIEDGVCTGARFLTEDGHAASVRAGATLVATGGAGQVYRETTNPDVATGDGVAMAFRAGAAVADLEFVQFHPTVLDVAGAPRFLLSEALRGEGARIVNGSGEPFMERVDPRGDLAPRDRVARAIVRERERTGAAVYLSMQHLPADAVHARFPFISAACRTAGLDLARDLVPISPAAHYAMGGILTDLEARTSCAGLFAAGEVASTGVHGANRLASNSLLEGLVFGARAGMAMRQWREHTTEWAGPRCSTAATIDQSANGASPMAMDAEAVRDRMWRDVGLFRDGVPLRRAAMDLESAWRVLPIGEPTSPAAVRTSSVVTVAFLMARAALRREESRGGHFRSDFPARDDERWRRRCVDRLVS
jgi:L-aspartate oxidase